MRENDFENEMRDYKKQKHNSSLPPSTFTCCVLCTSIITTQIPRVVTSLQITKRVRIQGFRTEEQHIVRVQNQRCWQFYNFYLLTSEQMKSYHFLFHALHLLMPIGAILADTSDYKDFW